MRRGQAARSHSANGEGHPLAKEIREINDIGECEISAGSPGDTDALIEVENVLAPAKEVELGEGGWRDLQLSDDSSDFG